MVYDPKTWATGELITAEDLNRLEQAVDATDAALDGKVDGTDARLSDARTPTDHQHAIGDVTGLADALRWGQFDSGLRNITSLGPNIAAGNLYLQRIGGTVFLLGDGVRLADVAGVYTDLLPAGALPTAYRPARTFWMHTVTDAGLARRIGVAANGWVPIYKSPSKSDIYFFTISWPTSTPPPTGMLPGGPA